MEPLVSVIVPSLNRPDFLRATLRSVESQTFKDFEVIVQDNASAIDIAPVVAEFPSLRSWVYRNNTTLPQTQNIALAISRATGKYVAILCDDGCRGRGVKLQLVLKQNYPPSNGEYRSGNKPGHGKYVAILCDDDLWQPSFLSALVTGLEERTIAS